MSEQDVATPSVQERVRSYAAECEARGLLPYQGEWLSSEAIRQRIDSEVSESRIRLFEIGFLYGGLFLVAMLALLLTWKLCY